MLINFYKKSRLKIILFDRKEIRKKSTAFSNNINPYSNNNSNKNMPVKSKFLLIFLSLLPASIHSACELKRAIRPETAEIDIDCCGLPDPLTITKKLSSRDSGKLSVEETIYQSFRSADQIFPNYKNLWVRNPNNHGITSAYTLSSSLYDGIYICDSTDKNGVKKSYQIEIDILEPPEKPECDFPLGSILENNSTVEFSCQSKGGNPLPEYEWYHNDVKLTNALAFSQGIKILNTEKTNGKSVLRIPSVNQQHAGKWYCTAKNQVTPNFGRDNRCEPRTFELGAFSMGTVVYIVGVSVPSATGIILIFICLIGCLFKRLRRRKDGNYRNNSNNNHNNRNNNDSRSLDSRESKSSFLSTFCSCCCYTDSEDESYDDEEEHEGNDVVLGGWGEDKIYGS